MPLLCFTFFVLEVPEISKFSQIFKKLTRENAGRSKNMRRMKLKTFEKLFQNINLIYKKYRGYTQFQRQNMYNCVINPIIVILLKKITKQCVLGGSS